MNTGNTITLRRYLRDAMCAHALPAILTATITLAFGFLSLQSVLVIFAVMLGLTMPVILVLSWMSSGRVDYHQVKSALLFACGYPYPKYLLFLVLLVGAQLYGPTVATILFVVTIVPALLSIRLFGLLALRIVDPGLLGRAKPTPA